MAEPCGCSGGTGVGTTVMRAGGSGGALRYVVLDNQGRCAVSSEGACVTFDDRASAEQAQIDGSISGTVQAVMLEGSGV